MPTISKIRFTNVVYDNGNKRYADEIFHFHGENGAIVLENGGGKTVFIQTALQAILPHTTLANRKVKDTYNFDDGPVHIAIEWIKNDRPRIYALTAITIFPYQNTIDSYRYVYEYGPNDPNSIEHLPFTRPLSQQKKRIASHTEMKDYYSEMSQNSQAAHTFSTITTFTEYIEKNFQIIADEWKSIVTINSAEGDVEKFFEACATEKALYEKLLIPTVEQSIADFEKHRFVDIFEQQRDKFKLLKQLNAQLKEYDVIQKELSNYVQVMKTLHDYQEQYEAAKQKGKAYSALLTTSLNEHEEKLLQLDEQQQKLDDRVARLTMKEKSYDIAVMKETLQQLTAIYDELVSECDVIQTKLDEQELYFGNMKYANEKRLLKQAKEQLAQYQKELQQIDEQYSTEELLDQLDEVKAKIRGNFLSEQERYEEQKVKVDKEKRQTEALLNKQQQLIQKLTKEQQQLDKVITKFETEKTLYEKQAEGIKKDLFEDVQSEQSIMDLKTACIQESQLLDEQIVQLKNEEQHLRLQKQQFEKRLQDIAGELIDLKEKETKVEQKKTSIEENEKHLRSELMTVLPRISENTSLYLKEASLIQDLTQAWEKKERHYADKLHEERLAFRYVDDYGGQQSFFADPYIAKKLPVWSQRFSYLETAIEYAMGDELPVETELLAITLITTEEEKEKLEQLVIDSANYLTYPIQIWTLPEVIAISRGELEPQTKLLQPALWQQLSDIEAFQQWQKEAKQIAETSKQQREVADEERTRIKGILAKLQDFYSQYPLFFYQQLQEQLKQLKGKTYEVNKEKADLTKESANADEKLGKLQAQIKYKHEQKTYYDKKIEKLLQYEKLLKEIQQVEQELNLEKQKLKTLLGELTKANKEEQTLRIELEDISERMHSINRNFEVLKAERYLYKQVTTYAPKFTDESYEVLAQQYNQIDNQIKGINSNREQMEKLIHQQNELIKRYETQLQQLRNEFSKIDEQFELPLDYEQQLAQLPTNIKNLKEQRSLLSKKCDQAKEEKDKQEGALEIKLQELKEEPITFELPLPTVKFQLEEEKKSLKLQQKQINDAKEKLLNAKKALEEVEKAIQILNGEHQFLAPTVKAMTLTTEEERDFHYQQQYFIDLLKKNLDDLKGSKDRYAEVVKESKSQFIQFCSQQISEVRLRNSIIDGIKVKDNYEDLVKHQHDMENTIHMSRRYTEDNIKKHDEQLVEFVNRVHKHLRKVVEELKHIPRKTKVHVDGEDVYIYRFTIPDWTDEEGITQIRVRIDWIMDQLEQIESRTVDEQESKQKSRKQLEEWLSTVQLLRYITQNKEWRVACRKVMNDNRISKTYETWSRSNSWSGGEKWSKNMALFLGVLNYVAEKRQYISPKKKSRTVILDNPFGKASSDHVLSPVFFIAKLLGFQIIALTAHVEGKFLHDYFPVVYSCRLRTAVGTDKLVMETKKTMHQAFFRDHDEDAGESIQTDQLSLFLD